MLKELLFDTPDPISMDGWKDIPIIESGEDLVCMNGVHERILVYPQYIKMNLPNALEKMYLRIGACTRLISAADNLPSGYKFVIWDAFRPREVQESLFSTFQSVLRLRYPNEPDEQIDLITQTYVSKPSLDPNKPSPHITGGAIDLTVQGTDGRLLDMGTDFDHFGIEAQTAYFKYTPHGQTIHKNRSILYTAMAKAGFTNYPEEWWHFDYGNQFWAYLRKTKALYSVATTQVVGLSDKRTTVNA